MKFKPVAGFGLGLEVASRVEAWIEILRPQEPLTLRLVASRVEAWIEIS